MIEAAFDKVRKITRTEALKKTDRKEKLEKNKNRIVNPFDYNPRTPAIGPVLNKHYRAMLRTNTNLKQVFPGKPMAGLRQGKNLKRLICRAKLYPKPSSRPTRNTRSTPGWYPCSKFSNKQCPVCPFTLPPTSTVTGLASGYVHYIKDTVTCQDDNILYYWRCVKTNCQDYPQCEYVGKSCRSFLQRLSEHRDYIKRGVTTEASGEHFSKPGHSVSDFKGLVLEKVKNKRDPFILKSREHFYIQKFNTYRQGLNRER